MTTRNSNNEPLLPITDPEEILRTACRRARLDAALAATNPILVPLPCSPVLSNNTNLPTTPPFVNTDLPGTAPQPTLFDEPDAMQQSSGNPNAQNLAPPVPPNQEVEGELSITDCFKTLLTIQKNTAVQFQAAQLQAKRAQAWADKQRHHDAERLAAVEEQRRLENERFAEQRRLDAERIAAIDEQRRLDNARFEEQRRIDTKKLALLEEIAKNSVTKQESTPAPATRVDGRIDLTRFRTSDGPQFKGPFQVVEPFLTWMQGVEIFFSTRNVTHSDDKRLVLGALITETNLLSYYANVSVSYEGKSWDEFRDCLFKFCLPKDWRTELRQTIKHLEMSNSNSFMEYSGRARTLQSLVNFEKHSFSDLDLAKFVMFGLPHALKTKVKDFQLLATKDFNYSEFKSQTNGFYATLPRTRSTATRAPSTLSSNPMELLDPEAYLWRLFSYLDSPANYVAPRAWKNAQGPLGPSAGKATGRPAGVAAASVEAPAFDEAGVSAVAMIEGHLEAEALNYGDDPLTFIEQDREDSEPSDTEETPIIAENLLLANVQMTDASQVGY
ncbi:hypothetical protein PTTG_26651 [Puccinia triticina 1-1 BBBD Race 1]|uniref:Retrotransposon gag domain-containing protein n=1 Tax=Puccinia triticina (isolate 1-1 / race 1 (BBBD)) TaxID=630390 RepID=A0A180GSH7_PUCT1|nr:hypothetical protein PTTG_26651 [Puccinia triticina 1-1 BBBD Race 1]